MKSLRRLLILSILLLVSSCNTFSVGGGVHGGSNGDVDVGVGVGIQL